MINEIWESCLFIYQLGAPALYRIRGQSSNRAYRSRISDGNAATLCADYFAFLEKHLATNAGDKPLVQLFCWLKRPSVLFGHDYLESLITNLYLVQRFMRITE